MNEVASLPNCKELYELSGWDDTKDTYKRLAGLHDLKWKDWFFADYNNGKWDDVGEQSVPAYSLGYLLRKLPIGHPENNVFAELSVHRYLKDKWSAIWQTEDMETEVMQIADTPEDALCKLAIELFKQGVLKK